MKPALRIVDAADPLPRKRWPWQRVRPRPLLGLAVIAAGIVLGLGVWHDPSLGGWSDELAGAAFAASAAYLFWYHHRDRDRRYWIGVGLLVIVAAGLVVLIAMAMPRGFLPFLYLILACAAFGAVRGWLAPANTVVHVHRWENGHGPDA